MLQVNGLYRHFKGGFYIVNHIALFEASPDENDPMVVYTSVETGKTWLRPLSSFVADVSDREDNVTGQKHRFELATDLRGIMSFMSTKDLVKELEQRPDNPYDGIKNLEEDENVWAVQFLLGIVETKTDLDTGDNYEEFVPVTPQVWNDYNAAVSYRDLHFAHRPCVVARRVTRKIADL